MLWREAAPVFTIWRSIARHVRLKEARQVARSYLLDWRDDGHRPFASLLVAKQVEDALIRPCQQWAALNYKQPSPVAAIDAPGRPPGAFARQVFADSPILGSGAIL